MMVMMKMAVAMRGKRKVVVVVTVVTRKEKLAVVVTEITEVMVVMILVVVAVKRKVVVVDATVRLWDKISLVEGPRHAQAEDTRLAWGLRA